MRSSVANHHPRHRAGAWIWIVGFLALFMGLLVGQQWYFRQQMPRAAAELAAAEAEGPALFEKIGTPPDSKPRDAGEKRYGTGTRNDTWQGIQTHLTWSRAYEVPGDFETVAAWYRQRLPGDGWVSFDDTPPSSVQREWKRGKWIVMLGRHADFPNYTRLGLTLSWDFNRSAE